MKKLFLSVFAIAGLVACVQTEVVSTANFGDQIGFGEAIVNKTARSVDPSTTDASIADFTVWAYVDDSTGLVLENEFVTKGGDGKWSYSNLQYWVRNHDYRFFALTPYNAEVAGNTTVVEASTNPYDNGLGKIQFVNASKGTEDLLYASETPTTKGGIPAYVQFKFDHLLSKVKFSFTNGFATDNVTLAVKEVKMVVPSTGQVILNGHDDYAWALVEPTTNVVTLEFGDIEKAARVAVGTKGYTDDERLTIPAGVDQQYKVTFVVDLYMGDKLLDTYNRTTYIKGCELKPGHAYNFTATLSPDNLTGDEEDALQPIVFDAIEVDSWVEPNVYDGGEIATNMVGNIDELKAALAVAAEKKASTTITFANDIVGTAVVPELQNAKITIDGNGYKLVGALHINGGSTYAGGTTAIKNVNFEYTDASVLFDDAYIYCGTLNGDTNVRYPDNVTIENCTFVGADAVAAKFWSLKGNLVVKDVTATGMHSLLQLTSCSTANVAVDGVTVDCEKGISLGDTANTTIKNSTIKGADYGIRANGAVANLAIESTTIAAAKPFVVRYVTAGKYNVALGANVVLTPASDIYQVVFTTGNDDAAYVAPAANLFNYTSVDAVEVFPAHTAVDSLTDLNTALAAGENVTLSADVTVAASEAGSNGYGATGITHNGGILNGNGHNLGVNKWGTWDSAICAKGGTIKNLTVNAGFRGIFVLNNTEKVYLENVTIDGTVYTISCDQGNYGGLEATNSTFNGWTSYAATIGAVKFVDCSFGEGQGYAFCRPFSPTTFVGCEFAEGFKLDAQAAVTLEKCTLNGVALTASNLSQLVVGGASNVTVK